MMKINFSKKVFLVAGLVILSAGCVFTAIQLVTAETPNPGHKASEVGGDTDAERTFAGSTSDKYTFPGALDVSGTINGMNWETGDPATGIKDYIDQQIGSIADAQCGVCTEFDDTQGICVPIAANS